MKLGRPRRRIPTSLPTGSEPPPGGTTNPISPDGLFRTDVNPKWWTRLPASPVIDANSTAIVNYWSSAGLVPYFGRRSYSVYTYYATASTPLQSWTVDGKGTYQNVPTDPSWVAAPGSDGHMCVIKQNPDGTGCMFDFYQADVTAKTAHHLVSGPLPSLGLYQSRESVRASGIPVHLGCVTPTDISSGVITHMLAMTGPRQGWMCLEPPKGGAYDNAYRSQAQWEAAFPGAPTNTAFHEGMIVQLDPAFNVAAIADSTTRVVAKALQDYGACMIDGTGADISILGSGWNGSQGGLSMSGIPTGSLRILDSTGKVTITSIGQEVNSCAVWG